MSLLVFQGLMSNMLQRGSNIIYGCSEIFWEYCKTSWEYCVLYGLKLNMPSYKGALISYLSILKYLEGSVGH